MVCLIAGCSNQKKTDVSPCPNDLVFKNNQCFCGSEGLSLEDVRQWDCIDQTHYLCLKNNGCVKEETIYPCWSFLGDHAGSFDAQIPSQPKSPKGYKLTVDDSGQYAWQCQDRDCACGKGILHGYNGREFCNDETFQAAEMRDCGDEACKIKENGVCRDGKCWCGELWQGTDAEKYHCTEHSVYGEGIYKELNHHEIKPEDRCDGSPELCDYWEAEIQKSKESPFDLICQAEEGCACGTQTCPKATVCRQDKCYCGDIELSQWKDIEHYACVIEGPNTSMVCTSKNGCICGDHRIVEGAACVDGKQVCHRMTFDWLNEKDIAQYMCDEVHPMIVCRNPKGCKCGKETCLEGTSCIEGSCVCGNTYKLSVDIASHRNQYICRNGAYTCNRAEGCECGLDEMCIQGAVCSDGECKCGEVTQATMSQYESYSCQLSMDEVYSLVCNQEKGCPCKEYGKDVTCDKGDVCEAYGCSYGNNRGYEMRDPSNEDWRIGNQRFISRSDDDGNTRIESCRNCDAFTAYEIEYDGTCHGTIINWMCMTNGGCIHDGKHYPYGTEFFETFDQNNPFIRYSGFPDLQYTTGSQGDAVAVCNHIYPYSVLVSYLQSGTITEIRDTWVCDAKKCACGASTCQLGDLCRQGKCTPYEGCSPKEPTDVQVLYCHGVQQSPEILADNTDTEHYRCEFQSGSEEKMKHWYCQKPPCMCGENSCLAGSYCQNGTCMCGDKPMLEGFICKNDTLVCNSTSCQCGNETLREGYACIAGRQLCTLKEGCICGDRMAAYMDLCDHNVDICNPFDRTSDETKKYVSSSTHSGCLCGDTPLPPKHRCEAGKAICTEDSCPCGDALCGRGDICDHNVCKCGTDPNNGCLCGNDVVRDAEHYKCIDSHLVCYSQEIRDSDHYPKGLPTCTCGNEQIPFGAVCRDNHVCKDCPHTEYAVFDDDNYHKTCDWKGGKVDIAYDYVADCYPSEEGDGYSCGDDSEYYYIRTIDPCDCLNDPKTPQTEEELAKLFCSITQYYTYDCSERYPEETVSGWLSIDGDSNSDDGYDPDNPCQKAAGTSNFEHRCNTKDQTCLCGKFEILMQDAEKYYCDMELAWRCNVETGCDCGDVVCKQSQICLKPGVCSQ